ncbi:MAG: hypothetical protein LC687_02040, partial [Actinobacteria bacterium]|nr:hypothetical protein [Actinomycetota bacterium]
WEDDWPLIAEERAKKALFDTIKHGHTKISTYNYQWTDPETLEQDRELIQLVEDADKLRKEINLGI